MTSHDFTIKIDKRDQDDQYWQKKSEWSILTITWLHDQDWLHDHIENSCDSELYSEDIIST